MSVAVFSVVDLCLFENILVCCSAVTVSNFATLRFAGQVINLLELIQALLPTSVTLDTDLNTTKDDLFSTLKVDTQLDNITVVEGVCTALHAWTAQANMVQKGAGTTLNVFDKPLTIVAPEFAMPATDNLALEANRSCRFGTCLGIDGLVSFGIPADLYSLTSSGDCASHDRKGEGWSRSTRLVVRDKSNSRGLFFVGGCSLRQRSNSRFSRVCGGGGSRSGVVVSSRRSILIDSCSSCTGHVLGRRFRLSRLRLCSKPGQGTLASDSRDPAVGSGITTKWGTRGSLACTAGRRTGTAIECRGTSGRWGSRGIVGLIGVGGIRS